MPYKVYQHGTLIRTGSMPRQLPGVKLAPLSAASDADLARHGLVIEYYEPDPPPDPTPEQLTQEMNREVHDYICGHYDEGTQISFQALYSDPDTPSEVKDDIHLVWDWVRSVMDYYYGQKEQLESGQIVDWDFSQFDDTVPAVKLADYMRST